MHGLIIVGVLAVAALLRKKPAPGAPGPAFVAEATPDLPVKVTGASYARIMLGGRAIFVDVATGNEITQAEAARRAMAGEPALNDGT